MLGTLPDTQLPILHWFIEPAAYQAAIDHRLTDQTESAVLVFDGRLYDGVQVRVRGQSSRYFDKPSWRFFLPQGHELTAPSLTVYNTQRANITVVNQISFVQDFDVEVAQTSFIADPVIGVIQDGIMLNFRALSHRGTIDVYESRAYGEALGKLTDKDLGDDRKAWAAWYKNERREAKKRARSE